MKSTTYVPRIAAFLLAAVPIAPATAQVSPEPAPPPPPPPSAWEVTTDEALKSVRIAATAKDGATRFIIACKAGQPALSGFFSRYKGAALRTDGQVEAVTLFAEGAEWRDAYSVRLRYVAASGTWVFAQPLSPVFLGSFSRGATLSVVNGRNQEVAAFNLTGSTAATRAMRATCGLSSTPQAG